MELARWFSFLLLAYAASGIIFAIPFLIAGLQRIDPQARGAGLGFRLIVFPGVVALWPLLLKRWLRGMPEPPEERNAHRDAAQRGLPND